MLHFLRWLKGYFRVRIYGYSPERFMNLCKINGILLWNISMDMDAGYLICICRKDVKKIQVFLEKTRTEMEIQRKIGLPFFVFKNKKRLPFVIGVIGCLIALYGLSFFIWAYDIRGNQSIEEGVIIRLLKSHGVTYGTYKKGINIQEIEEQVREYFDNVSWVSVKIEGTNLIVSIKEIEAVQEVTDDIYQQENIARHIYAEADGEIIDIITRTGIPKVKVGDQVAVGQILIEGYVPIYDDAGVLLHYNEVQASGDYTIRTTLHIKRELSRYYKYKKYTGEEQTIPYFRIGNHYFSPYFLFREYDMYEIDESEDTFTLFEKLEIPVYFGKRRYIEYFEQEDIYEEEEGKVLLNQYVENLMKELSEKGVQIIQKNVKIDVGNQKISLMGEFLIDISREY